MSQVSAEFILPDPRRANSYFVSSRRGEEDDTSGHCLRFGAGGRA